MSMSRLAMRRGPDFTAIFLVLGALVVAAFFGLLTSYLPWLLTVFMVLIPAVLVGAAAWPQIVLILALMCIFEVVPLAFQPPVPFGGGRLQTFDLLSAYLGAALLVRALISGRHPLLSMGPIRWPLYYLAACMTVSMVYVRYFAPNPLLLAEGRAAIAWLVVPMIALAVDTPSRFRWFFRSVVAIGVVIALYVTIQSVFSIRIMTGARVEVLDTGANNDIVRSIAGGGVYIVMFSLFLILNWLVQRRISWIWGLPTALLLVAGIGAQFGRGVWIAGVVGLMISAMMFRGVVGVIRIALVGLFAVGLMLSAASVFKPRIAEALIARATGIGAEIDHGGSYNWRLQEDDAALAYIERNPWMGAGIGGRYKQISSFGGQFSTIELNYIHNGYLYFPLKMGLFATFIPLAFVVAFIATIRQGQARHCGEGRDPALVAALCGAFAVPVITSVTQPEWISPQGIAAFSIFMGLSLLYRQMGSPAAAPPAPAR